MDDRVLASESSDSAIWPAGSFEVTKSFNNNRGAPGTRTSPLDVSDGNMMTSSFNVTPRSARLTCAVFASIFLLGALCLYWIAKPPEASNPEPYVPTSTSVGQFLWFSDIHLDRNADPDIKAGTPQEECRCRKDNGTDVAKCKSDVNASYGRYYCDTPMQLLESALKAARAVLPEPDFIISTGDFVRHEVDKMGKSLGCGTFEMAHISEVTSKMRDAFPNQLRIHHPASAFSLGNTDVDHSIAGRGCNQELLDLIANQWTEPLNLGEQAKKDLSHGGYYSVSLNPVLHILVLNTMLYVPRENDVSEVIVEDPMGQFAWFEHELEDARSRHSKVYIIGHISPGIDFYTLRPKWVEMYVTKYVHLIEEYWDVIRAQLFGHEHKNLFRLLPDAHLRSAIPILQAASVSPWFGNVPMFHVVKYAKHSMQLIDVASYGAPGILQAEGALGGGSSKFTDEWKQMFTLSDTYRRFRRLSSQGFALFLDDLEEDEELLGRFLENMDGRKLVDIPGKTQCMSHPSDVTKCKAEVICALANIMKSDFDSCRKQMRNGRPRRGRRGGRRGIRPGRDDDPVPDNDEDDLDFHERTILG